MREARWADQFPRMGWLDPAGLFALWARPDRPLGGERTMRRASSIKPLCMEWMARAGEPCAKYVDHRGPHRSIASVDRRRERNREYQHEWNTKNPEYAREWRTRNPEKVREYRQRTNGRTSLMISFEELQAVSWTKSSDVAAWTR
jgi:hypothetical protein